MIVFGSRMYGRKNSVKGWGYCENCGKYVKNTSYNGRKWGHLYYIPIIPEGPHVRVVKECSKCSCGMHIPEKDVPGILNDLCQSTNNALAALIAEEKTFDDNGTAVSSVGYLAGAVEMLLCLQADEHLRLLVSALWEKDLNHAYNLVNGELLEFQGKLDEAAEAYQQAVECDSCDSLSLMSLGSIHMKRGAYQNAENAFEKALKLAEDKFSVLQILLTVYDSSGNYSRLAETYEECFDLVPEFADDKKVLKAYKKACKKAGKLQNHI